MCKYFTIKISKNIWKFAYDGSQALYVQKYFSQVYGCKNISFRATYLFSSTKVWMCQVTLLMDASLCANIYLEKPQRGNDWCSLLCSFPRKKPLNTCCTYLLFLWFIPYDLPTINAVLKKRVIKMYETETYDELIII